MMPTRFDALPTATWPRLRNLLDGHAAGGPVINMTIGEPKHKFPDWVRPTLVEAMEGFNSYPDNNGTPELRGAITGFLQRRYAIDLDMDNQVMVLNGTREGLFNAVVALGQTGSKILIPNPFYQVYTVAAMAIGAQSVYLQARAESGFLPDLDALTPEELNQTSAFFLCSPSNPQGAVASEAYWSRLLTLAETYDFKIFADECYSEIYRAAPPPGALQVAAQMGADPERVVAFHSLSKRSNLPGLRSGF
ncbi:aminotransferase class I/II-fold pyridoxal phosphate-dependent enzyme, partial [Planktomarina temperata]|nr:aminotransferase class I/II-fold pyridoxal phosphate-dependent enzyme [Planktomarina temperata]